MRKYLKRLSFVFKVKKFVPFLKEFFISKEVPLRQKIIGMVCVLGYIFFPFDLIPDFIVVFGIVDDVFITTFFLQLMVKIAPESLRKKYRISE